MDTSAPKRRKTSPRSSIPVQPEADAVAEEAQSNPASGSPPPDRATAAKKRPSFASPTKASLERHNPEILRRRTSPPKASRSDQNTALANSRPTSRGGFSGAVLRGGSLEQQTTEPGASQKGKGLDAPGGEESFLRSPARRPAASARPTGIPKPRPLPPPGPDDDDEILNPFARRGLRRSPNLGDPAVEPTIPEPELEPEPEPELPPTPEHPDPVVSTPPSGIHNTPSRRPRRSKVLAERLKSSSPLKNVASSPDQPPEAPPVFRLPSKPSRLSQVHAEPSPTLTTAELRGLEPLDADAPKKKQRDALLAEIAALEADLALASTENERLRQSHLSKTTPPAPPNASAILSLLTRHALPPSADPPSPDAWLLDPLSFLPFSKPTALPPLTSPDPPQPPPTSHHPLPLPAPTALPFLQVFSPLAFTSTITPLPDTTPLLQHHAITATAPRGLFTARVEMTVNTRTSAITDLSVPRLDPAARAELGQFVEGICTAEGSSSGTTKNVSVLMWAMGEWVRLATERARVWGVLERELAEGLRGMVGWMRRRKARRRGGEEEEDGEGKKGEVDLLPFMGRTSAEYDVPVLAAEDQDGGERSTLRVQWRIAFDWTGEGRNEIGVLVGVPGRWNKADERGRLAGMPGLFNELIEGGEDPLTAVRTVACLLAGEERAS